MHRDIVLKTRFHIEDIVVSGIDKHTTEKVDALIRQGIRRESFGQMEQQSQYTYRTQAVEEQKQDPLDRLAKLTDLKQKEKCYRNMSFLFLYIRSKTNSDTEWVYVSY